MFLSAVTKYQLSLPHDEVVEFTFPELNGFVIWLVAAYNDPVLPLKLSDTLSVKRQGEVIMFSGKKGGIAMGHVPDVCHEMVTLIPSLLFPSVHSVGERYINAVKEVEDILGYYDGHDQSILPFGLRVNNDRMYHVLSSQLIKRSKSGFQRYWFPAALLTK